MANKYISQFTEDTTPAANDLVLTQDVSDTTDNAEGTYKKVTKTNFLTGTSDIVLPSQTTASGKYLKSNGTTASWETVTGGSGDVTGPASSTLDHIPQFSYTTGTSLKDGLGVVTTLGSPGADTNVPTEKAVRAAIASAGGGDVAGPASSTDNAIARFDATTGKLLQNSSATVDDNGGINIPTGQTYNINGSAHTHSQYAPTASPTFTGTVTLPTGLTGVIRTDSGVVSVDTDVTDIVSAASESAQGKVELATTSEATTGTDTARAVTPAGVKACTDALNSLTVTAAPSADVTTSGLKISLTAGETLAFGNICYVKSDGKAWKADANGTSTYPGLFMATGSVSADASGTFLALGIARNDAWAWTVGGFLYLSTTAGDMTQTAPSTATEQVQILGVATHADRAWFYPQIILLERA